MLEPGSYLEATVLDTDLLGDTCPEARNAVIVAKTTLARENLALYSPLATPGATIRPRFKATAKARLHRAE